MTHYYFAQMVHNGRREPVKERGGGANNEYRYVKKIYEGRVDEAEKN